MRFLNVGCGSSPTPGWINYDNSASLRLARHPILVSMLRVLGILSPTQLDFIEFARRTPELRWADARKRVPEPDGTLDALYSSHMLELEHLDRAEAAQFLAEARRVLRPGGVLRISVPDIRIGVERYRADGDADRFVDRTTLVASAEKGVAARIRCLATGARHHQWMYDGPSLCRLLEKAGFEEVAVVEPGVTRIPPRARWTCINVRPTASSWRRRAPDSGPGFREQTLEGPAPALPEYMKRYSACG